MPKSAILSDHIDAFCGLDVGKSSHHATALNRRGERLCDLPLPEDEVRLQAVFTELQAHGRLLVIVDQPNTIGALPIAVARDSGCEVAHLPGLAMRKAADLYRAKLRRILRMHSIFPTRPIHATYLARRGPGQRGALGAENPGLIRCRPGP